MRNCLAISNTRTQIHIVRALPHRTPSVQYSSSHLENLEAGLDQKRELASKRQVRAWLAPFNAAEVVDVRPRPVVPLGEADGLGVRREQPCLVTGNDTTPHDVARVCETKNRKVVKDKQNIIMQYVRKTF